MNVEDCPECGKERFTGDERATDSPTPLWRVEDQLVAAKKAAQNGNREDCQRKTAAALEMLKQ